MRDLAFGPVVSWALGARLVSWLFRFIGGFRRGEVGLTLGEVGGSRSLRGGMDMCRGLGRTLFGF